MTMLKTSAADRTAVTIVRSFLFTPINNLRPYRHLCRRRFLRSSFKLFRSFLRLFPAIFFLRLADAYIKPRIRLSFPAKANVIRVWMRLEPSVVVSARKTQELAQDLLPEDGLDDPAGVVPPPGAGGQGEELIDRRGDNAGVDLGMLPAEADQLLFLLLFLDP